jgi:hypothetical protein
VSRRPSLGKDSDRALATRRGLPNAPRPAISEAYVTWYKSFTLYRIVGVLGLLVVLLAAFFIKGAVYFDYVALVCVGFVLGWMYAVLVARLCR